MSLKCTTGSSRVQLEREPFPNSSTFQGLSPTLPLFFLLTYLQEHDLADWLPDFVYIVILSLGLIEAGWLPPPPGAEQGSTDTPG